MPAWCGLMCLTPVETPGSSNTFTNDFRTMLARRYQQASSPHEASTAPPGTPAAAMAAKNDAQYPLPPSVASFPFLGSSSSSSLASSSPPNGDSSDYATDDDAPRPCLSASRQNDIRVLHRNAKQAVGLRRAQWLRRRRRASMSSSSCNNSSAENSSTVVIPKQPAAVDDAAAAAAFTRRRLLLEEFCLAGTLVRHN
jgi:hypothetical protein